MRKINNNRKHSINTDANLTIDLNLDIDLANLNKTYYFEHLIQVLFSRAFRTLH